MVEELGFAEFVPVLREVLAGGGSYLLFPTGVSMRPTVRQGVDRVRLVLPPELLRVGQIGLFQRGDGSYVLHRVVRRVKGGYLICGDNQLVTERVDEEWDVVAVVSEIDGKDGKKRDFGVVWVVLYRLPTLKKVVQKVLNRIM